MKTFIIYSDGSDFKHTTHRLGIGAVLVDPETGNQVDSLSSQVSEDYLQCFYGTSDCSNPTMEMLAARIALEKFSSKIPSGSKVILKADYMGVSKWIRKEWKINKPYIQKINTEISELIIKKYSGNVSAEWIPGHQKSGSTDAYWNDVVDKLAKGQ